MPTTPSMSQLLVSSPDIPFPVKAALEAARAARAGTISIAWRRHAASLLQAAFGLDPDESLELVDLGADGGRCLAA
jgi:hypothetical protein